MSGVGLIYFCGAIAAFVTFGVVLFTVSFMEGRRKGSPQPATDQMPLPTSAATVSV